MAGDPKTATPRKIRETFAENLRMLTRLEPSISKVCQDLGVNRTQFNRYLNAESHPRPEVLLRICNFFGVDARILLEPLEALIEERDRQLDPALPIGNFLPQMRKFDHDQVPDGFYHMRCPSPDSADETQTSLLMLKTLSDGSKSASLATPISRAMSGAQRQSWVARRRDGIVFQHSMGVSILLSPSHLNRSMAFCYFGVGFGASENTFVGYQTIGRPTTTMQAQTVPMILEYAGNTLRDGRYISQRTGISPYDALSAAEKEYFESWSPFGPFTAQWQTSRYRSSSTS